MIRTPLSFSKTNRSVFSTMTHIGMVPTPVLYFATNYLNTGTGVMLTGSHNPANYNGLKMMIAGNTLSGETIQGLKKRIDTGDLVTGNGSRTTAYFL